MTSQNKVTAAVVQYVLPEKGLITVKHGKVLVSLKFFLFFCRWLFLTPIRDYYGSNVTHTIFFSAASKEEKPESKDLLADLQDISDNERKTSTAESSLGELNCNLQI